MTPGSNNKDLSFLQTLYKKDRASFWRQCPQNMSVAQNKDMIAFFAQEIVALPFDDQRKELQPLWKWVDNIRNTYVMSDTFQETLNLFFNEAIKQRKPEFPNVFEETFFETIVSLNDGLFDAFWESKTKFYIQFLKDRPPALRTLKTWHDHGTIGYPDCIRVVRQLAIDDPSLYLPQLFRQDASFFLEALDDPSFLMKHSLKSWDDAVSPLFDFCPAGHHLLKKWQHRLMLFLKTTFARNSDLVGVLSSEESFQGSWGLLRQWLHHLEPPFLVESFLCDPQAFECYLSSIPYSKKKDVFHYLVERHQDMLNKMPSFQKWGISEAMVDITTHKTSSSSKKM